MRFVAVEFNNGLTGNHDIGYLKIPENFTPDWHLGFRKYLQEKYHTCKIDIYPLNVHLDPNTMGHKVLGYKNMEDDFNMALRSCMYYPTSHDSDAIRREWAQLDPKCPDFIRKNR